MEINHKSSSSLRVRSGLQAGSTICADWDTKCLGTVSKGYPPSNQTVWTNCTREIDWAGKKCWDRVYASGGVGQCIRCG